MKTGTRVIVGGLDPYRGMTGTLMGRTKIKKFRLGGSGGLFEVRLDDGRVIYTSHVTKHEEAVPMSRPEKLYEIRERHTVRKTGPHEDQSITLTVTPQRPDAERLVIFFQNAETVRLVIEELQRDGE